VATGSTGPEDQTPAPGTPGGPGPFSEDEIAAVTGPGPADDLDEVEAVAIEEDSDDAAPDLETSFEKLITKSRKLSPDRIPTVIESVLFVAARPESCVKSSANSNGEIDGMSARATATVLFVAETNLPSPLKRIRPVPTAILLPVAGSLSELV